MPQRISIRLGASKDGALAQRSAHIPNHIALLVPRSRGGICNRIAEQRSSHTLRRAQLLSRFETGREGEGTRREAIFSYF